MSTGRHRSTWKRKKPCSISSPEPLSPIATSLWRRP
jgi:hypothetical protein